MQPIAFATTERSVVMGPYVRRDDIDIDALILSYAPSAIAQRGMNMPCNPDPDIGDGKCRKTKIKR
jgi:hypothetical protein